LTVSGKLNNARAVVLMKENLSGRLKIEPDQVMGLSGFKADYNESKFTAQVNIQHYRARQYSTL